MTPYYDMLNEILESGEDRGDRTGVGTRSLFGVQKRYRNIGKQFPLDTTRELNFRQIVGELLWMLRGNTNIRELVSQGFHLWSDWPYKRFCQEIEKEVAEHKEKTGSVPEYSVLTRTEFNRRIAEDEHFAAQWGDCGPVYGKQWRAWDDKGRTAETVDQIPNNVHAWTNLGARGAGIRYDATVDQISNLVADLKKSPLSRRHIVSAWNVADIPAMIPSGLPPCHVMFQFYCSQLSLKQRLDTEFDGEIKTIGFPLKLHELERGNITEKDISAAQSEDCHKILDVAGYSRYRLHCQLYQRSLDSVLGGPYNIASYSLLTMMLAQQCNMVPGDFIHSVGDAHIYNDHREKLEHQLARRPYDAPTVKIKKAKDISSYTIDDFELIGYEYHPAIRYPIAV